MKKIDRRINKYALILIGIIILPVQLSCKPNRNNSRITVASAGKISSVDPAQASTFNALQVISALGDPLYRLNQEGDLIPILATEEPRISKDGKSIIIPLRKGVFFHDGTVFNADAMAFSINRFIKIGTMNYILGDRISSVQAIDPYLLRIKLNRKSSSINGLLTSINLTPVSPNSYLGFENKFLNNTFIGTGPYRLVNFTSHHQRMIPFETYWGKRPLNDGIDYISLSNSTSLFVALKSKEIDVLLSSSIDVDQSKYLNQMSSKGLIKEGKGKSLEIGFISINTSLPPMNQPNLRKALSLILDRELISTRVSYGLRRPLRSIVPPSLKANFSPWPKYAPNKAKKLMVEAGYCSSKKMVIPLTFRSNVPADKLLAITWKEQIERDLPNCLELKLNGMESTTIYRQLNKGTFSTVILDWRGAYPDPEAYLTPLLSCTKIINSKCKEGEAVTSGTFWGSTKLEKSLKESERLNGIERLRKLREVEEIAAYGTSFLPIWLVTPKAWVQTNLNEPKFDGSGHLLLNLLQKINK